MHLDNLRQEFRDLIESHCPESMRNRIYHFEEAASTYGTDDAFLWLKTMSDRGLTVPTWPKAYGGAGLSYEENKVYLEELARARALPPLTGMGVTMIGPTLLDFGTPEQKERHLPKIASGEVRWCQGYSEPGAGSDLAGLRTSAVLDGDHYRINGQKIWTSNAMHAKWMFILVRTEPNAPKHNGISFLLLNMQQDGVTVKPIQLISGSSPFCEVFLDDALAHTSDLVGKLNEGWTVGKKLLQYERAIVNPPTSEENKSVNEYAEIAKAYLGEEDGKIAEQAYRSEILKQSMDERAMELTIERVLEESKSTAAASPASSIFKYIVSSLSQNGAALKAKLRGTAGLGWEGEGFSDSDIKATRNWLRDRASTIYGGTNEVQLNIIAKRVLGLPD